MIHLSIYLIINMKVCLNHYQNIESNVESNIEQWAIEVVLSNPKMRSKWKKCVYCSFY